MVPTTDQKEALRRSKSRNKFTPYQNFLFKRLVYGISVYEDDDIDRMHWDKRNRIKMVHRKAKRALNCLKQEICNEAANIFFMKYFPHSATSIGIIDVPVDWTSCTIAEDTTAKIKLLTAKLKEIRNSKAPRSLVIARFRDVRKQLREKEFEMYLYELRNMIDIKELGVSKSDIADRLIRDKLLPKDFYLVKKDPNEDKRLPRLGKKKEHLEATVENM